MTSKRKLLTSALMCECVIRTMPDKLHSTISAAMQNVSYASVNVCAVWFISQYIASICYDYCITCIDIQPNREIFNQLLFKFSNHGHTTNSDSVPNSLCLQFFSIFNYNANFANCNLLFRVVSAAGKTRINRTKTNLELIQSECVNVCMHFVPQKA